MTRQDSDALLGKLFDKIAEHFPEQPLARKSDLAMDLYDEVYKWANPDVDIDEGEIDL